MTYGRFDEAENKAVPAGVAVNPAYEISPGDVLVSRANTKAYVGAPVLVGGCRPRLLLSDKSLRLIPNRAVDKRWLVYALRSPQVRAYIEEKASGTKDSMRNISQATLKDTPLVLPPIAEQVRIVEALEVLLSRLDVGNELLQNLALRLTKLANSASLITSGFHVQNPNGAAPLPSKSGALDGSLPMLPQDWAWQRLGEIADVVGGVTKDSKKQQDPSHPLVPYLRVANVQRGRLDLNHVTLIRVPQKKLDQLRLLPGDVLMNEGGDRDKLGRGWVWEGLMDDVIHQNHVFRARIKDEVLLPKLLSWWANSMGRWFEKNGNQSTNLASISLKKIKELPVPIPPADVQLDILKRIEEQSLFAAKAEVALRLAQRRSALLRKSLLRSAFSGRLVPQKSDDEPAAAILDCIRAEQVAQPKPKRTRKVPAARKAAATVPAPEPTEPPQTSVQQELPL